jgi:hypothetical protein
MGSLEDVEQDYACGFIRDGGVTFNRWFATTVWWGSADEDSKLYPATVYNNGDYVVLWDISETEEEIAYMRMYEDPILKKLNDLESIVDDLVAEFEYKYLGWTLETDSWSVWGPYMKSGNL